MSLNEKEIDLINKGGRSRVVLDNVKPFLDASRAAAVEELKSYFRAKKTEASLYMAKVASLCALDDLEANLRQTILRAEQLTEKRNKL